MLDPATNGNRIPLDLSASQSEGDEGGLQAPPGLSPLGKLWWWIKFWLFVKTARLRFIAVLLAVGGTIAYWDTLKAHYEKWTRPSAQATEAGAGSEFWCPMHPTVIREKPDKCPICGMPLSKRKKGDTADDEALPPGVISRVQLTPYRVALANIQTWQVHSLPLFKEIRAVGFVEFDERKLARISTRVTGKSRIEKLFVNVTGQTVREGDPVAELYSPDLVVTWQNLLDARKLRNADLETMTRERLRLWGVEGEQVDEMLRANKPATRVTIRAPISGHIIKKYQVEGEYVEEGARLFDVADLSTVWIEAQVYEDELSFLKGGLDVSATTKAYPNREYHGRVSFVHPHLDSLTRTLRVRFDVENGDHQLRPGMYATVRIKTPIAKLEAFVEARVQRQRDGLLAESAFASLFGPSLAMPPLGTGTLVQSAGEWALARQQEVLVVPEQSVIDTGSRKIVYREQEPGVYDAVEVHLGPRAGGFYPVLRGLEFGDKVATQGAFLIDAETRLTSGAGSTFFGASGGPQSEKKGSAVRPSMTDDQDAKIGQSLAKLGGVDQKLAQAQKFCPILKNSVLGSMGKPVKIVLEGQPVFLCCRGCEKEARDHPSETLTTVNRLKGGGASAPAAKIDPDEAEIREKLAMLAPADRALAEAQRFCAVQAKSPLGSMGVPPKLMIQGNAVFLCCDGCEKAALRSPAATLDIAKKLKAQNNKK